MAGTGNLILKTGTAMPYDPASDDSANDTGAPTIVKGMPAAQLVGLSRFYTGTGLPYDNFPNRIWTGMNGYGEGTSPTETVENQTSSPFIVPATYTGSPNDITLRYKRPLWTGAEIRAFTPLKDNAGSTGDFVILKADWNDPSDYVLVTQRAIAAMPLRFYEKTAFADDTTPANEVGAREYIEFSGWDGVLSPRVPYKLTTSTRYFFPGNSGVADSPSAGWVMYCVATDNPSGNGSAQDVYLGFKDVIVAFADFVGTNTGSNVAILGSDGAIKGKQTFLSPIGIENYLELLPYSDNGNNLPATIKSTTVGAASIFDENITDITMGGEAELIELGDQSTNNNTLVTVHGDLTVTGEINISETTVIDGGTY